MINFFKFNMRLFLYNKKLTNSIAFVNCCLSHCQCGETPNILVSAVRFVYYQLCYLIGFLSYNSYTLQLCKLGVHVRLFSAETLDTLGWIIFIHHLRSTILFDLAKFKKLSRYCPISIRGFYRFCPVIIHGDISLLHRRHIYNK